MPLEKIMTRLDELAAKPKILVITALISICLVFLQAWFSLFSTDDTRDSYNYYYAAKAIDQGFNPYDVDVLRDIARKEDMHEGIGPYLYPPFFAGIWRSVIWMSARNVHSLLIIGNALLLGWALWLVVHIARPQRHPYALIFLFLLFQTINGPAVTCLRMGQITPLIALLVFLCLYLHLQGRETLSALALALAILIKISPAILIIYFLLFYYRRWWYLAKTCAWIGLFALASLPWATPEAWLNFFQSYATGLPDQAPYSIWGWLQIHVLPFPFLENKKLLTYLLIALPLTICTVLSIRNQSPADQSLYAFSMLIMLSLLIHPVTWHQHFYIWLLPGFYFSAYHWGRQNYGRACIWAFLVLIVMTRVPGPLLMLRPVGTLLAMLLELRLTPPRVEVA